MTQDIETKSRLLGRRSTFIFAVNSQYKSFKRENVICIERVQDNDVIHVVEIRPSGNWAIDLVLKKLGRCFSTISVL